MYRLAFWGSTSAAKVVRSTHVYLRVYRNDGRCRVLRLGVGGHLAEGLLGLVLQGQGVTVEDAASAVAGDGHRLVSRDAGVHQVGDGGAVCRVLWKTKPPCFRPMG